MADKVPQTLDDEEYRTFGVARAQQILRKGEATDRKVENWGQQQDKRNDN